MSYINLFLPIGGFSIGLFISLLSNKFKSNTFRQKDIFISSVFILICSIFILFCNLGFTLLNINGQLSNIILIFSLYLIVMIFIFFRIYTLLLCFLITTVAYLLNIYSSKLFSIYLTDVFSIPLSSIIVFKYLCSNKKN